ncbi:helicase-associated domain-containing protein [Janibacter hoylei]|uniref:helicase-associated domain-containing protein n=1 Tax=Janibacter hoylei TaxID=364298 RepID=UPI0024919134|nr:helicase-associated domain-containing protein [Janibacter hoylei]
MRSLAEDIRHRSDVELVALLDLRPDLARPQPADLTALAARASTRASTARAVDHLDLPHLTALQACAVTGSTDPAVIAPLLGTDEGGAAPFVEHLTTAALLWRSTDGLALSRTVVDVLGPHPAGLGPTAHSLGHALPDDLAGAVADLSPEARRVLERVALHGPTATVPTDPASRAGQAVAELVDTGLVAAPDAEHVLVPREVALVVRGGRLVDAPLDETTSTARTLSPDDVDRAATAAATELVALVDELLDHLDETSPRVLRSGGMAVRDLRSLAGRVDLDEPATTFLLELALGAQLLADDHALEPTWRLTSVVDEWRARSTADRWAALAGPWLDSLRASVVPAPEDGGRVNALSEGMVWPPVRALRHEVLDILAALPEGSAPDLEEVMRRLRHRRPRRMPHGADEAVAALLREGEQLGVTGRGALGSFGRLLTTDAARAGQHLAELVPEPVDRLLLQADLTAIVPGTPVPELAALLRRSATLESRGGASVHRFTETSLRAALDAGWTADDLLDTLSRYSAGPVPQPLDYLVRDVARRHGQLLVGAAGSYLRSDDPTHLEALLTHRELSHLQLRQLAPTVLVSPVGPTVLLEALREVGSAPALEGPGGVVSSRPGAPRITPRRARPVTEIAPEPSDEVVRRLREGEARADRQRALPHDDGPVIPALDPASSAALLREAAADRLPVWLGVTDAVGATRRLLFHPTSIDGGRVGGEVDAVQQVFSLHRITGVVIDG